MALLRSRNFALLFTGQGVSRLGDGLYVSAMAWLAWTLTRSTDAVALVTIAANAPAFVLTLVGASYADRYDRRRLMIGTDLARGALVGVAALLLALGLLHLALLVALAAVLAAIGAPFAPARNALVTRIAPAEALVTANGLLQVSFRAAFFVGPLLLAPLLAIASMPVVLILDALTFAVSAVTLTAIDLPGATAARTRPGLREDLGASLAVLRRQPDVLLVIATFVLALAAASGFLTVGMIALVGQKLGGHPAEYGLLLGIAGAAEVCGALIVARLHLRNLALTAVLAWVLLGAFRLPLGLVTGPLLAACLLAITGFASALTDIPLIALVQQRIPDRHLAKVLGFWEAGIAGAIALAPIVATAVIDSVGVSTGFILSGAALMVIGTTAMLALKRFSGQDMVSSPSRGHMHRTALGLRRGPLAPDLDTVLPAKASAMPCPGTTLRRPRHGHAPAVTASYRRGHSSPHRTCARPGIRLLPIPPSSVYSRAAAASERSADLHRRANAPLKTHGTCHRGQTQPAAVTKLQVPQQDTRAI